MEYEGVLEGLDTEPLVQHPAVSIPIPEGSQVAVTIDPAGAVLVRA